MDTYQPENPSQESLGASSPPEPPTLEYLNPWVSIIYRPRDTIRYVLDTGVWNNFWIILAIIFAVTLPGSALSFYVQFLSGELQGTASPVPMGIVYVGIFLAQLVLGYPISIVILFIGSWLYKIIGSGLDGEADYKELRITVAWTNVVNMYIALLMIVPNGMLAVYYSSIDSLSPAVQLGTALMFIAIGLPMLLVYFVIVSKCVGEAHKFSAWKGFVVLFFTLLIFAVVAMFLIFLLIAFFVVIAMVMAG